MLKEKRSYIMSMIKSRNTKPEMIVRKYLFSKGFRYRIHVKSLPGSPDIVLPKYRVAIFVNGCFWHGHDCPEFRPPKVRTDFWMNKINRNRERDTAVRQQLRELGWRTMAIWECQLKSKVRQETLDNVVLLLEKSYLDLYRRKLSKPYEPIETNNPTIAADPMTEYGKAEE